GGRGGGGWERGWEARGRGGERGSGGEVPVRTARRSQGQDGGWSFHVAATQIRPASAHAPLSTAPVTWKRISLGVYGSTAKASAVSLAVSSLTPRTPSPPAGRCPGTATEGSCGGRSGCRSRTSWPPTRGRVRSDGRGACPSGR